MSDQQEYAGVPTLSRYIDVPQRGFNLASHNAIRPSCMDDPRKLWRVRLNNWNRCEPYEDSGIEIKWHELTRYTLRFNGRVYGFNGAWKTVLEAMLDILTGASAGQSLPESPPSRSRSQYHGVAYEPHKLVNKWRSQCYLDGHCHYIGAFPTEVLAAKAYDDYVILEGLEDRKTLNFPDGVGNE